MPTLVERLKRLVAPTESLEAEDMAARSVRAGCTTISQAQCRSRVRLCGSIVAVTSEAHRLTMRLSDGTGSVRLMWMGRSKLDAIKPGVTVLVEGRLGREGEDLVMFNPDFEVIR